MYTARNIGVLISGICALVMSLGIARYAFTPMIPAMQEQLEMTESLAGWLAGWNYIGYLSGLFMVWLMRDLRVKDFFYRYGLIVVVVATAMMAASDNRLVWYVSRFFAGVASATGFMLGTGLIMNWLQRHQYKGDLGLHFTGVGLGIIVSALVVDAMNPEGLSELHWRMQWVILAGVAAVLLIPAMFLLPFPKEQDKEMSRTDDMLADVEPPSDRWLWLLTGAYFCAGFSNTLNVTFTSLITELQPLDGLGARMWLLVGIAATPAPLIWDAIARRIGSLDALRIAFVLNIAGNLCLALTNSVATTALAAVLFGFTFMGIVSQTLSTVGRLYGSKATKIMAQLTFGYCIAQILSPILSGIIAEQTGNFSLPLYAVSALMVVGLFSLLSLRREYTPRPA
ncbi:MAG: YbfB/YjiJ family MFS transporter [Pseudomonadota bacterium]